MFRVVLRNRVERCSKTALGYNFERYSCQPAHGFNLRREISDADHETWSKKAGLLWSILGFAQENVAELNLTVRCGTVREGQAAGYLVRNAKEL